MRQQHVEESIEKEEAVGDQQICLDLGHLRWDVSDVE